MASSPLPFNRNRQIMYFSHCLTKLPHVYSKLDTNRLTLVHFCVQALDLLGSLDAIPKDHILSWLEELQTEDGAYLGGTFLPKSEGGPYRQAHIAMSYTALCIYAALDPENMDKHISKERMTASLKQLQREDGSFQCVSHGSEHDMRFLYCACAISHMLGDWSGVDQEKAVAFIQSCRSWDGAIALIPGQEGHGGSTFCGIAALALMGQLETVMAENQWRQDLIRWCCTRQVGGMQGRPNKDEDTCYSYWIGGTLRLLGRDDLLDQAALQKYILTCQSPMGGFGKIIGAYPDVLHSFYSMAWLSLSSNRESNEEGLEDAGIDLRPLNCTLGICQERANLFGTSLP